MLPEASIARMFAKCVLQINLALFSPFEKIDLPLHTNERKAGANRFKYKNLNKEANFKSSFETLS